MSSRTLVNLVLLGIVAVLIAVVAFEPGVEKPAPEPTLTALKGDAIDRIHVQRTGHDDVDLERKDGRWQLRMDKKGPLLPADGFRITNLLAVLQTTSHAQFVPQPDELAKYNLVQPRVRLRLNDVEIAFGDSDPLHNHRYVLVGNTVHLITDNVYQHLVAARSEFVDKALLPGNPRIAAITLPGLSATQGEDGKWHFKPSRGDLSADALNSFIDEWRYAQAVEVKTGATDKSQGKVAIRLKDGSELHFEILAREPELVLARPDWGLQYHFSAPSAKRLFDPAEHQTAEPAGDAT